MERFGINQQQLIMKSDPQFGWNSSSIQTGGSLDVAMLQLRLGKEESFSYPERLGEPDCVYYMRTGSCGYGDRCRYNHPRDRSLVVGAIRQGGEFPEREGQPVCEFYMKTGTCKFGVYCKFHHPRTGAGTMIPAAVNCYGYPIRPGETECSYYMKSGQCKFGLACKFHHPNPAGASMPARAPAPAPTFYPMVQSPSVSSQPYGGVPTSWQLPRPTILSGSYVQGAYAPMLLPPGMVHIPGWGHYPAPLSPVASPGLGTGTQPTVRAGPLYGVAQLSSSATEFMGPYHPLPSLAVSSSSSMKEHMFPERPGEPECQYYIRTGDCKFGTSCRYHHPPERTVPETNSVLSTMGLPLRPGAPPCTFYMQHGICKFGPTCKFDHPMEKLSYRPPALALADMPVAPYPVCSSLATLAPSSSSSEFRPEFITGSHIPYSSRLPSSMNSTGLVGSMFSKSGPVLHPNFQFLGQSLVPSRVGSGGDVRSSN
ncbi:hypothetical protein MKW94_025035 [Papaver nudicaule]|uniref:C3H1-type domain-containing protein n=1 Tax=Papaver nudicaule TaxID=74823 RepID=A0AA41RWS3_PAPNU|nr:hypothetical protein [Papaver nudicaule]